MDFLKKLFSGGSAKPESRFHTFSVKCMRCGEVIEGRVDLSNDLSADYEGDQEIFYVRKVLMGVGGNRCFQRVEVEFKFSPARELIERHATGGEFV